ncbi:MAG: PEP-CTERM sorting domain-containing protein [Armatimonadota bacterium]
MRAFIIAAILIACCTQAWCLEANAQPYSALVLGEPLNVAGPSIWDYTLTNTSPNTSYTVWLLAIEIDEATEVVNINSPRGWACDWSVPHFISWMYVTGELSTAQSQIGFQAEFSQVPEYQTWTVMFNNTDNPGESPTDFGTVATSLPEPSSVVALMLGVTALAGLKNRKRL